jgi:tetraacyldisaccharide 4'-kinase
MNSGELLLKAVLALPAAGYHAVQKAWATAYGWGLLKARSAPVPVISVGNLLMGGSGKTPFVIALAQLLESQGLKPAVVSRGYRGTNRKEFLVVGDGTGGPPLVNPSVCGDEAYLMAERLPNTPVLIGRRRLHPARAALELFGCDVIVLDDGFQHLSLKRNVDVVLVNGAEDSMFPLGRLREPLSALARAEVVVLVGIDSIPVALARHIGAATVFRCQVVPVGFVRYGGAESDLASCAGKSVTLVSGIANPERFTRTVEAFGCSVREQLVFPDHHCLDDVELEGILNQLGDSPIIFTEKDWVKLPEWVKQRDGVMALRIEMLLEDPDRFLGCLSSLMARELR